MHERWCHCTVKMAKSVDLFLKYNVKFHSFTCIVLHLCLPLCILYKRLPKNTTRCGSEAQHTLYTRTWTQSLLALHYISSFVCMPCKFESRFAASVTQAAIAVNCLLQWSVFSSRWGILSLWFFSHLQTFDGNSIGPLQSCSVLALASLAVYDM